MPCKLLLKAYEKGYLQHMIAKVLGVPQPAVSGVIGGVGNELSLSPPNFIESEWQ